MDAEKERERVLMNRLRSQATIIALVPSNAKTTSTNNIRYRNSSSSSDYNIIFLPAHKIFGGIETVSINAVLTQY